MRAVVDHHVDRPDVDAQQCVQLTGPNRSIALENPLDPHPPTHVPRDQNLAIDPHPPLICCDDRVAMARVPHPIPSRTRP